ncbi:MAG: hypothetical protein GX488_02400 [Clostridiales bacterium]|nr:hypothetical protein [Clostridiales bacterium]
MHYYAINLDTTCTLCREHSILVRYVMLHRIEDIRLSDAGYIRMSL